MLETAIRAKILPIIINDTNMCAYQFSTLLGGGPGDEEESGDDVKGGEDVKSGDDVKGGEEA